MEADGSAVLPAACPSRPHVAAYGAPMARFCLLHGAWHDGSCWRTVADELIARGHAVLAPTLPLHDPAATYAARVRPALEALAAFEDQRAAPLVLVGHSMGSGYVPGLL
ncbi:MAG: alpha/beta hydrolase, partial [Solirubrobacterales bacterium]|nr:alpha/beta hydrolase [Solirubrobacterales bacterium]